MPKVMQNDAAKTPAMGGGPTVMKLWPGAGPCLGAGMAMSATATTEW
jgi:hypothetical protein